MAHELAIVNGKASMAFIGDRKDIWHGLGQQLTENASIETWSKEAIMDWNIMESRVQYQDVLRGELKGFEEKKVLYRGDTGEALSVVGADYKVVQPHEVLEFFRDLVAKQDMKLETAGCLFGGRRFWALANTGRVSAVGGDNVGGYLLLVTSADGTLATQASMVATRVVCNNTLTLALGEGSDNRVKISHRRVFDPTNVKQNLGLVDHAWEKFMENMTNLANTKISDAAAMETIQKIYSKEDGDISTRSKNQADKAYSLYMGNGMGSNPAKNTLWGVLNSVTEMVTHHNGARTADAKLWSSWYGSGANLNDKAYETLLAMAD